MVFKKKKMKELPPAPDEPKMEKANVPKDIGPSIDISSLGKPSVKERIKPTLPSKFQSIAEKKGPVFVSLNRYNEIKENIDILRKTTSILRHILDDLRDNKGQGANILEESTRGLEEIESNVENISKILRT